MQKIHGFLFILWFGCGLGHALGGDGVWTSHGPDAGAIFVLATDPFQAATVYAGSERKGVYRSQDGGATWDLLTSGVSTRVYAIGADPLQAGVLYVGAKMRGILKSTNGGASWAEINAGLTNLTVMKIVVNPANPSVVWAGTQAGVFRSGNGGANWTVVNHSGLAKASVSSLAIDPQNPSTVYVSTWGLGAFRTSDDGGSWSQLAVPDDYLHNVALDPSHPAIVYAASSNMGVLKSLDGGTTWTPMNGGITGLNVQILVVDERDSAHLWAGTNGGGVSESEDGGLTWRGRNEGLAADVVYALAVDPAGAGAVYAGGNVGGVFVAEFGTCLPPGLSAQPAGKTVLAGQTVTLQVETSGSGPFRYNWFQGEPGDTATPAPGAADSPVYTTPPLEAGAQFWVRVQNACGQVDSAAAVVKVMRSRCDLNADGVVDDQDVHLAADFLAETLPVLPLGNEYGDVNGDGRADTLDLQEVALAAGR